MSNERDDVETSAQVPEFFQKWHYRAVHDLAINQAIEVLQKALRRLSEDDLRGDGATLAWAKKSLQDKIHALRDSP